MSRMPRRQFKALLRAVTPPVVMPMGATEEHMRNLTANMRRGGFENLIVWSGDQERLAQPVATLAGKARGDAVAAPSETVSPDVHEREVARLRNDIENSQRVIVDGFDLLRDIRDRLGIPDNVNLLDEVKAFAQRAEAARTAHQKAEADLTDREIELSREKREHHDTRGQRDGLANFVSQIRAIFKVDAGYDLLGVIDDYMIAAEAKSHELEGLKAHLGPDSKGPLISDTFDGHRYLTKSNDFGAGLTRLVHVTQDLEKTLKDEKLKLAVLQGEYDRDTASLKAEIERLTAELATRPAARDMKAERQASVERRKAWTPTPPAPTTLPPLAPLNMVDDRRPKPASKLSLEAREYGDYITGKVTMGLSSSQIAQALRRERGIDRMTTGEVDRIRQEIGL